MHDLIVRLAREITCKWKSLKACRFQQKCLTDAKGVGLWERKAAADPSTSVGMTAAFAAVEASEANRPFDFLVAILCVAAFLR
jgi:hypothetical protein